MKPVPANSIPYEKFTILDKPAIFTNLRVDRKTLPEGLYAYDLRDECDGEINQLQTQVMVNHWGTVILKEEIPDAKKGIPISLDDYNYEGESITFEQFVELPKEKLWG